MPLRDTPYSYGLVSKLLHWTLALLILTNLVMGLFFGNMPKDLRFTLIMWHKSIGAAVLILMLARIIWRSAQGFPQLPEGIVLWQRRLARLVHVALYPILIAQPVTGWLLSSAAGHPVSVFGLFALPDLIGKNPLWAKAFDLAHDVLGYVILALLTAHITAAFYHHFIEGNKLIRRML